MGIHESPPLPEPVDSTGMNVVVVILGITVTMGVDACVVVVTAGNGVVAVVMGKVVVPKSGVGVEVGGKQSEASGLAQ